MKKIGICMAGDHVATLFVNSTSVEFYIERNHTLEHTGSIPVQNFDIQTRLKVLKQAEITLLICGAICNTTREFLENAGIEVEPWIRGKRDEIVDAYTRKDLSLVKMPGSKTN